MTNFSLPKKKNMRTLLIECCSPWWQQPRWNAATVAAAIVIIVSVFAPPAAAGPQINLLNKGCSQYNATGVAEFYTNLNVTFSDLRSQISNGGKRFGTAQQARTADPVYAMVQCRDYMSEADCVACFDAAVALIRNCTAANGARVIYDGCFLRGIGVIVVIWLCILIVARMRTLCDGNALN